MAELLHRALTGSIRDLLVRTTSQGQHCLGNRDTT